MADPLEMDDVLPQDASGEPNQPNQEAPTSHGGASDVPGGLQTYPGLGPLLEEKDPATVCRQILAMLRDQGPSRKRRRAIAERNKLWLQGVHGARVRRNSREDYNDVELVVPLGAFDVVNPLDRTAELVEKLTSHLLADPAVPDAEPATDSDTDRDAAEFTTRLLTVEGSESGYNNTATMRRACRKASIYGSAFVYPCIDPAGGGWRPMAMRAHPTAPHKDAATQIHEPGPDGQPMPVGDAPEEALTERYVRDDGSLTDERSEGARQWLPKIRPEVLTPEHVVLLPETCAGIADAYGVLLIRFTPLARAKREFPAIAKLTNAQLRELCDWRPEDAKHAEPAFVKGKQIGTSADSTVVPDSALVPSVVLYYRSHGDYPKGAYVVCGHPEVAPLLHRQPWVGVVETPEGGTEDECLEIPIAQVRQRDNDHDDDPMGWGIVSEVGAIEEMRGPITLAWLNYLEKLVNPNTFLPIGSIVQPGDLDRRDGTPIYYNPQGQPVQEELHPFPPDAKEFYDRATQAQNSVTGLEDTAQGVETPQAVSGVAKQIVVQQANTNLAGMRGNLADGQERLWRVLAQLYRCFYTVPQKLKYLGEDGAYKLREWSRVDLGSTRDIKIAKGSFTQQSPEQKQQSLDTRFQAGLIDAEEYERLSASNIRASIGTQDNPHRLRVRKQTAAWKDGPPEGWAEQQAAMQQQAAAMPPQIDPMTGQPLPPQIPPDPANPFADVRAVDSEQDVATIRHRELRREQAGSAYAKKPPQWRKYLDDATLAARQAAGIQTIAEQQQAAMQQQAMAQQAEAAEGEQEHGRSMEKQAQAGAQRLTEQSEKSRAESEMAESERHAQMMTAGMGA